MEIKKSQLRKIIKEQVSAFFVTPEPLGTVSRSKSIDAALRGHGFKSNDSEVNEKELDRAIQLTMKDLEAGAASRMRSKPMDEAVKGYDHPGKIKVGTLVHIGHAQKGGAGVEGKVTKIDGHTVHIKNKQGKTYKGALKNTAYLNEISGVDSLKPNDPHTPIDEAIRMSNEPRHMPARGYKGRAKKNHQEWVRKVHGLLPKNKIKSLDQLKVNQLYDYGSSPEDAAKALLKSGSIERSDKIKVGTLVHIGHAQKGGAGVEGRVTKIDGRTVHIKNKQGKTYKGALKNTAYLSEISDVDSLKPNDPSKKILQELKFVVRISGVGSVVIDGSSEGDVRTRLVKKLRGGKKSIESITRIAKDKAKRAEKNLGIAVVGDVAIDHSVDESKLNEANPADVKRMFAKQLSSTNKLMSLIKQSLGYLEKRHKGDPGNVQNLLFLSGIKNKLSNVEQDINKFPRK